MHLKNVVIENFKGLRNANFAPTSFACLVGENNAGKSSVLQAVVYALNRPTQLPVSLFYDTALPIRFRLTFEGVTDAHLTRLAPEHRERIASIVVNGALFLSVRYRTGEKVEVLTQRATPNELRYRQDAIDASLTGKRGAAIRTAVVTEYPEFAAGAPDQLTMAEAKVYLSQAISRLPADQFELVEAPLPSGISSSISLLLPEAIYIPAVKNLADDLKTTQSTSFGRLLALLLEDMTPDLAAVTGALESLNGLFNRVIEEGASVDRRHQKVRDLESTVQSFLEENFPRAKLELRIPPPDLKSILSTAQIYVDDGSRDLIDNKGDGIKRSLTFALLQAYVRQLAANANNVDQGLAAQRPLLFLFEEPELYLHPKSQRVLFNTLARISETHQVVVTTHSPLFFAPGVTASFIRVAKRVVAPKPVGELFPVDFALNQLRAETFRLARYENADAAFFSRRVVLFEGESDDAYCKHVAKLLNASWDFDEKNIGLVRVSGKGNFAKFRDFFNAFGIDVKLVADLDALFDGYQHLGSSAIADGLKGQAIQALDARIVALGVSCEPAARQIKDRVHSESWKGRYNTAKTALRALQQTRQINNETLDLLDHLFTWEQEIARVSVCRSDAEARTAIRPLLDQLRTEGICVLARGAIEDYYPEGAPTSGAKPERALAAAALVVDTATAIALSGSLEEGRTSELEQVFSEIFRDI